MRCDRRPTCYIDVCMDVYTSVPYLLYRCMYGCIHNCVRLYMYVYIVCLRAYVCMCACLYTESANRSTYVHCECIYVIVHVCAPTLTIILCTEYPNTDTYGMYSLCICPHMSTHKQTHTHTHTHAYIHICGTYAAVSQCAIGTCMSLRTHKNSHTHIHICGTYAAVVHKAH
jgi:hypothetical protein